MLGGQSQEKGASMDRELSIQHVAEKTGLSIHALRYYERLGLLVPIHRLPNVHRRYSEADLQWIEFLKCLRATGMSIAGVQRVAEVTRKGEATLRERRELLEIHRQRVSEHLQEVQQTLTRIDTKIAILRSHEVAQEHVAEKVASGSQALLKERRSS
jgi:DNA-binding transcriptional MerR regulator